MPTELQQTVDWRGYRIVPGDTVVYGKSNLGWPIEGVVEKIEQYEAGSTYGGWTRYEPFVILTCRITKADDLAYGGIGELMTISTRSAVCVPKNT